jgi:hypothetical protein
MYDWTTLDQALVAASANGKRRVELTIRGNPDWAAASRCRIASDAERQRLASFAQTLVKRYAGKLPDGKLSGSLASISAVQLYNEPDNTSEEFDSVNDLGGCFGTRDGTAATQDGRDAYAWMLESVGTAVHAASPTVHVVTGGVVSGNYTELASSACPVESSCLFDRGFLRGVLSTLRNDDALDRLDEVAVHFYSSQGALFLDAGPDLVGRIEHLRQDMRSAGLTDDQLKPILVDEGGYTGPSVVTPTAPFDLAQRDYVTRALARAAFAHVDGYFWFLLSDVPSGLGSDVGYGLVDVAGNQKPAYLAYRYFAHLVRSADQVAGSLTDGHSGLEGYEFSLPDGRSVQVLWNVTDQAPSTYLPPRQVLAVSDPVGSPVEPSSDGTISVSDEPRFLVLAADH